MFLTNQSLKFSEWLLVISFLILFATLFLFSKLHQHYRLSDPALQNFPPTVIVELTVEGAVLKPGVYSVESGTPLGAALKKAKPDRSADLALFDLMRPIVSSETITVPVFERLTIHIEVAPGTFVPIQMPLKSRTSDLKKKLIELGLEVPSSLKGKRFLKNQEIFLQEKCE
jgi:hypothetical protein